MAGLYKNSLIAYMETIQLILSFVPICRRRYKG